MAGPVAGPGPLPPASRRGCVGAPAAASAAARGGRHSARG